MTTLRRLTIPELSRIAEIDRSERITQQYRARGSELELIDVDVQAPRWGESGESSLEHYVDSWRAMLEAGGVLLGAFDGEGLVGVAVYDRSLTEEPARFAVLYVTRTHRRTGVGRALTREVVRLARADGARRLYVSATPTRATVDFYLSEGFRVLATPNERLLAAEPEDIHLALTL